MTWFYFIAAIILTGTLAGMWHGIGTMETTEEAIKRWKEGPPEDEKKHYKGNRRRTGRNRFRIPRPPYLRNLGQHACSAAA